jgi:hypothetical protein
LRFWRQEWYRWHGAVYRNLPAAEVRCELSQFIKREFDHCYRMEVAALEDLSKPTVRKVAKHTKPMVRKVTGRLVADVQNALMGIAMDYAIWP